MLKTAILGGLLGALIFCGYFYIIYLIFENPFLVNPKSIDFFIYVGAVAGSIYYYRYHVKKLYMTFWEGFVTGVLQTFVMASLCGLFIYVFLHSENKPLKLYIANTLHTLEQNKKGIEKNIGEKFYTQTYNEVKKTAPYDMAWFEWRTKLLLGVFITFIASLVMRKKQPQTLAFVENERVETPKKDKKVKTKNQQQK